MAQIPSIILDSRGSISTVRALMQIKDLLERMNPHDESEYDRIEASLQDVDTMLAHTSKS